MRDWNEYLAMNAGKAEWVAPMKDGSKWVVKAEHIRPRVPRGEKK